MMINLNATTSFLERLQISKLFLIGLVIFGATQQVVLAASRAAPDLTALSQGSELVFLGSVVDIRNAQSNESDNGIPHTFVTYEIEKVFQGSVDKVSAKLASKRSGETVTLRFVGGLRKSDGAVLRVSNVPRFDLGDRDVLFVRANGVANCPLTQFQNGRMRVIEKVLYSEEGQEIVRAGAGHYFLGAKHNFKEVTSHDVGGKTYTQLRDENEVGGEEAKDTKPIKAGQAITLKAFAEEMARISEQGPKGLRPVVSADPKQKFKGPSAEAVPANPEAK